LKARFSEAVKLLDGTSLHPVACIEQLGGPAGMLIFTSFDDVRAQLAGLHQSGYGYSVLSEPRTEDDYDAKGCQDMFSDWGWTDDPMLKPSWMSESDQPWSSS